MWDGKRNKYMISPETETWEHVKKFDQSNNILCATKHQVKQNSVCYPSEIPPIITAGIFVLSGQSINSFLESLGGND